VAILGAKLSVIIAAKISQLLNKQRLQ